MDGGPDERAGGVRRNNSGHAFTALPLALTLGSSLPEETYPGLNPERLLHGDADNVSAPPASPLVGSMKAEEWRPTA